MSITQPIIGRSPSGSLRCPRCNASLPTEATFCGSCGERIDRRVPGAWEKDSESPSQSLPQRAYETDIATRYRITSLVRRRPYVNLFFALDNRQQRMVAIRDIDISSLDEEAQTKAIELVESEYDLLRRSHIPHIMPVIDLRHFQSHIFVIGSSEPRWEIAVPRGVSESSSAPSAPEGTEGSNEQIQRLYTLQDLLQGGIGLPPEQIALDWINHLCRSLDALHKHQIVVGDLDPYTIILNTNSYENQPALMVSWLLPELRSLLPRTSTVTNTSYFSAPEALLGNAEPRSDIYSLGAILYLLLTGTPPDEPDWRNGSSNHQGEIDHSHQEIAETPFLSRQRLRSVRELNPHVSSGIDECIMRALSMEPAERFQNGEEMAEALRRGRSDTRLTTINSDANLETSTLQDQLAASTHELQKTEEVDETENVDTVRIVPLSQKNLQRWQSSRAQGRNLIPHRPKMDTPLPTDELIAEGDVPTIRVERGLASTKAPRVAAEPVTAAQSETQSSGTSSSTEDAQSLPATPIPGVVGGSGSNSLTLPERMKMWVTGKLPALKSILGGENSIKQQIGMRSRDAANVSSPARQLSAPSGPLAPSEAENSFLKQIQRFVLGQQRHTTTAAAIIEIPLRVQPNQEYAIRLHLIGRDEATPPDARNDIQPTGLSALIHGEQIFVEVRSALHQNFAYIVQQAALRIPAQGYEAEVTIPMQPLSIGPSGRRDRLHIFFLDEQHRPLYEKPFVVEILISHLVQSGREGHNVLTIPY